MGLPRTCIIGAGISGIAAMRAMQEADLPFVCYEAGSEVGGLWRYENDNGMSNIYRSLHTNTSRHRSGFSDYPMPEDYPDFPSHRQVFDYLQEYVERFAIRDHVRFRHQVEHVSKRADGCYAITVTRPDGTHQLETFEVLIVASGHHWQPHFPKPEGSFVGQMIHSSQYRTPVDFLDKRVLIVGVGNSACDIASDLVGMATSVAISTRRGAHVVPKYVLGRPIDLWTSDVMSRLPMAVQRMLFRLLLFLARGRQSSYGFPTPPNPLGTEHPTISSDLLNLVGHGRVNPRPPVESVSGLEVHFRDGTSEPFDAIIMATGFDVVFPFFDEETVHVVDNRVELYRHVVHPSLDRLFFVGLIQPLGALAPLAEAQSAWIADLINARCELPDRDEMWQQIHAEKERLERHYVTSRRHSMEVDFFDYRRQIRGERSPR